MIYGIGDKMTPEKTESRQDIEKLSGEGTLRVKGFFRNTTRYGVSYLLFTESDKPYSINGFAAEQFDSVAEELKGSVFDLPYEKQHSDTYDKDFIVLYNSKRVSTPAKALLKVED